MGRHSELFESAATLLETSGRRARERPDAVAFLEALGYWPLQKNSGTGQLHNRCALLRLAAKFDDVFELPAPYAPGISLFGALVSPTPAGLAEHGAAPAAAGGRGLSRATAFESCVGEAAEYLSFLEREDDDLIECIGPSQAPLDHASDWALAGLGLTAADAGTVSDWIAARSLIDSKTLYLPAELVVRRPETRRAGRRMAESNGVGAGITIEQAVQSGLLEIIERDAVALWWFGGRPAGSLDCGIESTVEFQEFVESVRRGIERHTWFLDLTTELGVPVVIALSCDDEGKAVVAGFSADPNLETAARKAYLELCQMEFAQHLALYKQRQFGDDALKEMDRTWIERSRHLNLKTCAQFKPSVSSLDTRSRYAEAASRDVEHRLHAKGFSPYMVDLTRAEIGIPVARVIVPGLQSAKPDWMSERLRTAAAASGFDIEGAMMRPSPI